MSATQMFVLMMNDMREPNIENLTAVRWSVNRSDLREWHDSLLVAPYRDGEWGKSFAHGSALEWFNPVGPMDWDEDQPYFGGVYIARGANVPTDFTGLKISKC